MKTISITNPKSKSEHKCQYCGEPIHKGDIYTYVRFNHNNKFGTVKSHENCLRVANMISENESYTMNSYYFNKSARKLLKRICDQSGKFISTNKIANKPIKSVVDCLVDVYETGKPKEDKEVIKKFIVVCSMMMMMPNLFDDVISEMEDKKLFKHASKSLLKKAITDFEDIGNALFKNFEGKEDVSYKMCDAGMNLYSCFDEAITLEGLEKKANILYYAIDILIDKLNDINKTHKVSDILQRIKKHKDGVNDSVPFQKQTATKMIISQYCGTEGLNIVD